MKTVYLDINTLDHLVTLSVPEPVSDEVKHEMRVVSKAIARHVEMRYAHALFYGTEMPRGMASLDLDVQVERARGEEAA